MPDAEPQQPPALYRAVLDHIIATMNSYLADGHQPPSTMFILHKGHVKEVLGGHFMRSKDKDLFAETVRQRAAKHQADALVMVSEIWSLPEEWTTLEKAAEFTRLYGNNVSSAPFRVSSMMLKLELPGTDWLGIAEIKSDSNAQGEADGQPRRLTPFRWRGPATVTEGRFTHLLVNNGGVA